MKVILGTCHGNVKKPAFFLDFGCRARSKIGWQATINRVQEKYRRR